MTVTSKLTEDSSQSLPHHIRPKKDIYHIAQRLNYSNSGKLDPNTEEYKKHFGVMEKRNRKVYMQKSVPIHINTDMPKTSRIGTMSPVELITK